MEQLRETLPFLILPFLACLTIAALHCYMGLHVLRRGVVFVDIALAQWAALGAAVALWLSPHILPTHLSLPQTSSQAELSNVTQELEGELQSLVQPQTAGSVPTVSPSSAAQTEAAHPHASFRYGFSLGFALLGAVLLSLARFRERVVPHEAVIGILFVVAAAFSVLILSKAPHGHEKIETMLIGSILFVAPAQLLRMALLYLGIGILHFLLRKHFLFISEDVEAAEQAGYRIYRWDILFFTTFALMVTESVALAGVLVVFSYLIIPAACARLVVEGFGKQLLLAWGIAVAVTAIGLVVSALADFPSGATIVTGFGLAFLLFAVYHKIHQKRLS